MTILCVHPNRCYPPECSSVCTLRTRNFATLDRAHRPQLIPKRSASHYAFPPYACFAVCTAPVPRCAMNTGMLNYAIQMCDSTSSKAAREHPYKNTARPDACINDLKINAISHFYYINTAGLVPGAIVPSAAPTPTTDDSNAAYNRSRCAGPNRFHVPTFFALLLSSTT